jgi:hypothetical protein
MPMTELLEKSKTFEWTPKREASFHELKKILTMAPVLTMPNMEKPFSIYCDASGQGLGCAYADLCLFLVCRSSRRKRATGEFPRH